MMNEYFPKTDVEYNLYFKIDELEKARNKSIERCYFLTDKLNEKISVAGKDTSCVKSALLKIKNDSELLNDVLMRIISKTDIEDIETYYSLYNSALLLNKRIETEILNGKFKKEYRLLADKKSWKNDHDTFFYTGNIICPKNSVGQSLVNNSAAIIAFIWIVSIIFIVVYIFFPQTDIVQKFVWFFVYLFATQGVYIFINIWIDAIRKNRNGKINYQNTYIHKPINKDFLGSTILDAIASKFKQ